MLPFSPIKEIHDLKGKRVLLRLDINEPIENGVVLNDFRIRQSLPTIQFLKKNGAKVIIIAHSDDSVPSLKPIARHMNKFMKVGFAPKTLGKITTSTVDGMQSGAVIILENLRSHAGEKKNSLVFARELARLGDVYVNEAFSSSHREHASIVQLPKLLPCYAGLLFQKEYESLNRVRNPVKPFVFLLGGAKLETKLPLVKKYLPLAKTIFVGGGLVNTLFKLKGYEMGKSVVGKYFTELKPLLANKKVLLPADVLLLTQKITSPDKLSHRDKIVDIGPRAIRDIKKSIYGAKTILFNGPVGIYNEGFGWGTEEILKLLSKSKAETVIGGGDTLAVVSKLKLENKFSFVSTAGGAMLEFLVKGTLPGIKALVTGNKK